MGIFSNPYWQCRSGMASRAATVLSYSSGKAPGLMVKCTQILKTEGPAAVAFASNCHSCHMDNPALAVTFSTIINLINQVLQSSRGLQSGAWSCQHTNLHKTTDFSQNSNWWMKRAAASWFPNNSNAVTMWPFSSWETMWITNVHASTLILLLFK